MKNKSMKKIYSLVLLLVCITTLTACLSTEARRKKVGERNKYELYLAHASQTDTVTDIFAMKFAELVEEKSKGRIDMNVYPNSQLGGDVEITEAVQRGNITFVVQTTAPQVPFVPEVAIFDAPMAFKNLKIARMVLDGELQEKLKKYYEQKHLRLLGYAD
ncbi:extracellular solute-binding protein, family 7 [[Eubacterium] yurii]|nr:extracellular solute-binding protein, family 7 [[Eubacterium] yurii]